MAVAVSTGEGMVIATHTPLLLLPTVNEVDAGSEEEEEEAGDTRSPVLLFSPPFSRSLSLCLWLVRSLFPAPHSSLRGSIFLICGSLGPEAEGSCLHHVVTWLEKNGGRGVYLRGKAEERGDVRLVVVEEEGFGCARQFV